MISLSLMQRTSLECAMTRTLTFKSGCDIQLVLVTLTLEERISQTKKTYLSISTRLSSTILQLCITEQSVANLRSKTALKWADNGLESSNENVSSMLLIFLKTIMCLPVNTLLNKSRQRAVQLRDNHATALVLQFCETSTFRKTNDLRANDNQIERIHSLSLVNFNHQQKTLYTVLK